MTENLDFVHLRTHSAYSLLEGALPIEKLVKLATEDAMPALALTDSNNLFGALEFSEKMSAAGIQPIIGCTLAIQLKEPEAPVPGLSYETQNTLPKPDGEIALLAQNKEGYLNLMWLTSQAYLAYGDSAMPHITLEDLKNHTSGLILLTGGPDGPVDKALSENDEKHARQFLEIFKELFENRCYVEVQRYKAGASALLEEKLLDLTYELELPLVATNESYFPKRDDFEAHDALICIADGRYVAEDDRRKLTLEHHFKSRDEMAALFSDLPEALENTVEIAKRCAYRPKMHPPILPQFVPTSDNQSIEDILQLEARELARQAHDGLKHRLDTQGLAPDCTEKDYKDRLEHELNIITSMKFPGYFLIVADFIKWAKQQNIPVGPGRGSGAGSLVAWSLTITDLDPMQFSLLFERFLNPERVSMPDFDIDFCQDRRDEVIRYVQDKYGEDRVAQIITFGKLQARAVLRDVGRVLQMPYGQVDKLCKMVPNNPANPVTLAEAIASEAKLQEARDSEEVVAQLLDTGQKLEGLYRHASTHAAGVVIGDRPLTELVPLYRDPRSELPATQFNMKWVEPAGLVKFDFLGLKTLTVIQKAIDFLKENGTDLDILHIPLDDKKSYELLASADTVGVFQLESSGMRDSLRKLRPDRFEDIIAMVALYRPGPMDNIPTYINRKHGKEEIDYLHPLLEPVLKETYGVIIYQEQVMQIAQILSHYSLGEADLLRRAMGKKIKAEMDKQRIRFLDGAKKNNIEKKQAEYIFELVNKFAGYGFNKSHAAAYALVAYQTAYLKANYPIEFMAAIMTLDQGNTDKIAMFYNASKVSGLEICPPSVNASYAEFKPEKGAIRYSLAALKNIGEGAVEHICELRERDGIFKDLADFTHRIEPRIINKRALETLAAAGAFDCLEKERGKVYNNVDRILAEANRSQADRTAGQNDLFAASGPDSKPTLELRASDPWLPLEKLTYEFDAIGFFLSGHPLDEYQNVLKQLGVETWTTFHKKIEAGQSYGVLAGIVTHCQERKSKSGNSFAFAGFSDATGQYETVVFSDTLNASRHLLEVGTPVLVRVEAEIDGEQIKTRLQSLESLDQVAQSVQKGVCLRLEPEVSFAKIEQSLSEKGKGKVFLRLKLEELEREVEVLLPRRYNISPQNIARLRTIPGVLEVQDI
ncbi:MAG: DNA polymerase III subunit alpha [Pseudomonadota bacterium]